MYKTAVYTPVNGVNTHQKQQISKSRGRPNFVFFFGARKRIVFIFLAFYFSAEKDIRIFVSFLFSVLKWP